MKKCGFLRGAGVAALMWCAPVAAQDTETRTAVVDEASTVYASIPIVVLESRGRPVDLADATGSLSFINADDLEDRQTRDVADALRDVPGVAVSAVAGQTQVRLRGSEANHVLVLVDGIEVSDPFGGEFDIGTLQAELGARIEVLRGPQSALYGADAIGGVITYQSDAFDGVSGFVEAGSNGTLNGAARIGRIDSEWEASLSAVVVSTDGEPNARGGSRDIGRDSYTLSVKGAVELSPDLQLRAVGRYIRTEGDFNDQDFNPASPTFGFVIDSPETRFENEAVYALVGARLDTLGGRWTHDLSAQLADISRDTFGPFGRTSGSEGDRLKASYVGALSLPDGHRVSFAADWERERFRNNDPFGFAFNGRRAIENVGLVGEYLYAGRRFDFSAAVRHDFNDRFADETTFRIGAGYDLTDTTRLRANIGSGIKNPGFFELFGFFDGVFIGNEDLQPEKSTSWEVGVDQQLFSDAVRLSVTYFDAELDDEIFTTFPPPNFIATPANRTTDSKRRGLELSASADLGGGFSLYAAYTYLDAEEDGVEEVRRPDHLASLVLNWSAKDDGVKVNLAVRHNGETRDLAFTDPSFIPVRVTLDDYTLVNLNARYRLSKGVELFGRVENLLDQSYEQVFSFASAGRTAIAGVSASF